MKKYQLFNEFSEAAVYGNNFTDAISAAQELQKPGTFENNIYYPGEILMIDKVIGIEDTDNSTRGSDKYERVIVQLLDGKRIGVDGKYICEIKEASNG